MFLIIIGLPGSGKGTQAKLLVEHFNLNYFEAGDFLREIAENNTRIREVMNSGKLVDEVDMTRYVTEYFDEKKDKLQNILFDGFPRFPSQYVAFKKWLAEKNLKIDVVIFLEVSDEEVMRRLSARRVCEKCETVFNLITNPPKTDKCDNCGGQLLQREDDTPKAIKIRLEYFHQNTDPMLSLMDNDEVLMKVNGERDITEISKDIISRIK